MANLARARLTSLPVLSSVALAMTASGCRVVGGIFKAGVWVGVLSVFLVIGLLAWGVKALLSR